MTHVPPPPATTPPTPPVNQTRLQQAPPPRSGRKILPVLLAAVIGGAVGFIAGAFKPLEPAKPPVASGVDLDCERILQADSVSLVENGDVVALLQEMESEDDVIGYIREQDTDFRFHPEDLYCLADAAVSTNVLREMLGLVATEAVEAAGEEAIADSDVADETVQPPKPPRRQPRATPKPQPRPKAPVQRKVTAPAPVTPKIEPRQPSGMLLPKGSPIVLKLLQEVHTKKISVGQSVPFEVAEPILVGGVTVIAGGTPVYAEVLDARRGRIMGKGAELSLKFTTVRALDGQMIRLDRIKEWAANSKDEAVDFADKVNADAREKYDSEDEVVDFSPGVFFKGKNIILPEGTHLTIYTPADCRIKRL